MTEITISLSRLLTPVGFFLFALGLGMGIGELDTIDQVRPAPAFFLYPGLIILLIGVIARYRRR
jgi:hypothetical protein